MGKVSTALSLLNPASFCINVASTKRHITKSLMIPTSIKFERPFSCSWCSTEDYKGLYTNRSPILTPQILQSPGVVIIRHKCVLPEEAVEPSALLGDGQCSAQPTKEPCWLLSLFPSTHGS